MKGSKNNEKIDEILDKKLLGISLLSQTTNCFTWFGRRTRGNGWPLTRSSITLKWLLNTSGKTETRLSAPSSIRCTSRRSSPLSPSKRKSPACGRKRKAPKTIRKMSKKSFWPTSSTAPWCLGSPSRTRVRRSWTTGNSRNSTLRNWLPSTRTTSWPDRSRRTDHFILTIHSHSFAFWSRILIL